MAPGRVAALGQRLREAARDNLLGDAARAFDARSARAAAPAAPQAEAVRAGAEAWARLVAKACDEYDFAELPLPTRQLRARDVAAQEGFLLVQLVKTVVKEQEGFGEEEEEEQGEGERVLHPHSLVQLATGEVFGVEPDGGPAWGEGPRASVLAPATLPLALNEKSGMLRLFGATIAELVLSLEAPVDLPDAFGETALMQAAACGHRDLVRWLLQRGGANANATTRAGATALLLAVDRGSPAHEDVARVLVGEGGADVNAANRWGVTPLHLAAFRGLLAMARLLIELGADQELRDHKGHAPRDYTAEDTCLRSADGTSHYDAELEAMLRAP